MANGRDFDRTEDGHESVADRAATMMEDVRLQAGATVRQVGKQARKAASSLASEASGRIAELAERQMETGADFVKEIAEAIRAAAEALDEGAPPAADLVRVAADRMESFSETIRDQSPQELLEAGADFARRQPAVVFGMAAIGGYVLYRVLNAAPTRADARAGLEEPADDDDRRRTPGRRKSTGKGKTSKTRTKRAAVAETEEHAHDA
jgi:hypothetical protein